jgi:hypothetical protein
MAEAGARPVLKREIGLFGATSLGIGALSCIGLIVFLSPVSWAIGRTGLLIGGTWYYFRRNAAS